MKLRLRIISFLLTMAMMLSMAVTPSSASSYQLWGDLDGDGVVNITDALQILMCLAKIPIAQKYRNNHPLYTQFNNLPSVCKAGGICNDDCGNVQACQNPKCGGTDCLNEHCDEVACNNPTCNGTTCNVCDDSGECLDCLLKSGRISELEIELAETKLDRDKWKMIHEAHMADCGSIACLVCPILEGLVDYWKEKAEANHCDHCELRFPDLTKCDGKGCLGGPTASSDPAFYLGNSAATLPSNTYTIVLGNKYEIISGVCREKDGCSLSCLKENLHSDVISFNTSSTDPARDNRKMTIRRGGNYRLVSAPGTTYEGQIIVNAFTRPRIEGQPRNLENVVIIMDGVNMHNQFGPVIYGRRSRSIDIRLRDGSVNYIQDEPDYEILYEDDDSGEEVTQVPISPQPNAVIFTHNNLEIKGRGTLEITARHRHGIVTRDNIDIQGGNIKINVESLEGVTKKNPDDPDGPRIPVLGDDGKQVMEPTGNAIMGRDSVLIRNGTFTINAGNHGIRSNNIQNHDCESNSGVVCGRTKTPKEPCNRGCWYNYGTALNPIRCGDRDGGICGESAPAHSGFIEIRRGKYLINAIGDALRAQSSLKISDTPSGTRNIDMIANSRVNSVDVCDECEENPCICEETVED